MNAVLALGLVLLAASPALAEHAGAATGDLALDFRIADGTFSLGGRFVTPDGFWRFSLDGARRDQGLTVQGRVQRDDRALNFRLDADADDARARGSLRWWRDPL